MSMGTLVWVTPAGCGSCRGGTSDGALGEGVVLGRFIPSSWGTELPVHHQGKQDCVHQACDSVWLKQRDQEVGSWHPGGVTWPQSPMERGLGTCPNFNPSCG